MLYHYSCNKIAKVLHFLQYKIIKSGRLLTLSGPFTNALTLVERRKLAYQKLVRTHD